MEAAIRELSHKIDNVSASVETAVQSAITAALQASETRVANLEQENVLLQRQLDATHVKFDEKLRELELRFGQMLDNQNKSIFKLQAESDSLGLKHDDQEMRSRKYNVRLHSIPYAKGETDNELQAKIIEECAKVDITLTPADITRYHRTSEPFEKKGVMMAQTILKLSNWRKRNEFRGANKTASSKKANFGCSNDLTAKRYELLQKCRTRITRSMLTKFDQRDIDAGLPDHQNAFIFSTPNGALFLRTPDGALFLRIGTKNHKITSDDQFEDIFRRGFQQIEGNLPAPDRNGRED